MSSGLYNPPSNPCPEGSSRGSSRSGTPKTQRPKSARITAPRLGTRRAAHGSVSGVSGASLAVNPEKRSASGAPRGEAPSVFVPRRGDVARRSASNPPNKWTADARPQMTDLARVTTRLSGTHRDRSAGFGSTARPDPSAAARVDAAPRLDGCGLGLSGISPCRGLTGRSRASGLRAGFRRRSREVP